MHKTLVYLVTRNGKKPNFFLFKFIIDFVGGFVVFVGDKVSLCSPNESGTC